MSALIIEIPFSTVTAQTSLRYVLSADGQTADRSGSAIATLLPKLGRTSTVTLVLVPQALSWHRVQWPKVNPRDRQRSRAVLNGLLEDQLLDDPESLHMALAPGTTASQPTWVCVCQKTWLESALTTLAQAGIEAPNIVPSFAPHNTLQENGLASTPHFYAMGTEGDAWLTITPADVDGQVLTLPLSPAVNALDFVAHSAPETAIQAEPSVFQLSQHILQRQAILLELPTYLLQAAQTRWNLAQFQFANAGKDRLAQGLRGNFQTLLHAPQWRWLRWGAVGLVLAQLVGLNAWAWQARQELQDKRAAVESVFRTTFANMPVVLDAPLQMQRELAKLQQQSGITTPDAFETLTSQTGSALQRAQLWLNPSSINYDGKALTLHGVQLDDAALQNWQNALNVDRLQLTTTDAQTVTIAPAARVKERP